MNSFIENNCRLCKRVFCCKKCRMKHEEHFHNINPNCNICVYGNIILRDITNDKILLHIKKIHWPLHCVLCRRQFNTIDEMYKHRKCPKAHMINKIHGTPLTPIENHHTNSNSDDDNNNKDKFKPSPLTRFNSLLPYNKDTGSIKTSTPLLSYNNSTINPIIITSTDQSELRLTYKSSMKSTSILNESKKSEKRVTFSKTHNTEDIIIETDAYISALDMLESDENLKDDPTIWKTAMNWSENKLLTLNDDNKDNNDHGDDDDHNNNNNEKIDLTENDQNNESSLWTSMNDIVKSVVVSVKRGFKRTKPDNDNYYYNSLQYGNNINNDDQNNTNELVPSIKRRKYTDIKCRDTIRELIPIRYVRSYKKSVSNKATQTD